MVICPPAIRADDRLAFAEQRLCLLAVAGAGDPKDGGLIGKGAPMNRFSPSCFQPVSSTQRTGALRTASRSRSWGSRRAMPWQPRMASMVPTEIYKPKSSPQRSAIWRRESRKPAARAGAEAGLSHRRYERE